MTLRPPEGRSDEGLNRVSERVSSAWDAAYTAAPAWEIGRAQSVFVSAGQAGLLCGRLLDIGCGTGETTLLAARSGAHAMGIDVSRLAIEIARAKAADRGISAEFRVADVTDLGWTGPLFDTAIDCGTFHLFAGGPGRAAYAGAVHDALRPGGTLHLLCARAERAGGWGPPGLSRADLSDSFSDGWQILSIEPSQFEVAPAAGVPGVDAWFVTVTRL